ncbi:MAG: hypothetical protein GXP54_04215, partial [Deltaproteobacteria bacterium]|nr:hypothetical protein [Deltaproteobacteria bacterium]
MRGASVNGARSASVTVFNPSVANERPFILSLIAVFVFFGCGLEGPIINRATRDRSTILPKAADNVITGAVEGAPDGTRVEAFSAGGEALEGVFGIVDQGRFEVRFPGNTEYTGVALQARWKGGQALALVPALPKQLSVLDAERVIDLGQDAEGMSPLSARSTAFTLVLWGKAISEGKGPAGLSADV